MLGRTDVPLDDTGRAQARLLGERLAAEPPAVVYASPMGRARETAAAILEAAERVRPGAIRNRAPLDAPGLQELDVGDLEGLTGKELGARFPGVMETWLERPLEFQPPGGESLPQAQERAWMGLQAVIDAERGRSGVVALVTHQVVIGALLARITGRSLGEFRSFFHKNTAFSTVEWSESPALLTLADAAHLG